MPYFDIDDLPRNVTHVLPTHAQEIYKEAFNNAYDEYKDASKRQGDGSREEVAHRVAWTAVKQHYSKSQDGRWRPKN